LVSSLRCGCAPRCLAHTRTRSLTFDVWLQLFAGCLVYVVHTYGLPLRLLFTLIPQCVYVHVLHRYFHHVPFTLPVTYILDSITFTFTVCVHTLGLYTRLLPVTYVCGSKHNHAFPTHTFYIRSCARCGRSYRVWLLIAFVLRLPVHGCYVWLPFAHCYSWLLVGYHPFAHACPHTFSRVRAHGFCTRCSSRTFETTLYDHGRLHSQHHCAAAPLRCGYSCFLCGLH